MKPNIIEGSDFEVFEAWYLGHETMMAQAKTLDGETKTMHGDLRGYIRVKLGKDLKHIGTNLKEAVAAYNELY